MVYILLVPKLTLTTGTLNGIIFHAQAANAGIIYNNVGWKFSIHIEDFHALCFYNGMTEILKTGLSLLFSIIIPPENCCFVHYTQLLFNMDFRISHSSILVLGTVVHLSFSNLLLMIVDVFSYAVYTNTSSSPVKV